MFAQLTRYNLHDLLHQLAADHTAAHRKLMDDSSGKLRVSVFSDEWAILNARQSETFETICAIQAEISRREYGRLDGCTCEAIRGSHKPPCAWAASRA